MRLTNVATVFDTKGGEYLQAREEFACGGELLLMG